MGIPFFKNPPTFFLQDFFFKKNKECTYLCVVKPLSQRLDWNGGTQA
jgi:hypothetical protein